MGRIYLALGSNVGNRQLNLRKAVDLIQKRVSDVKLSLVYETRPIGYENQDDFMNMALEGTTLLSPRQLLNFLKLVEQDVGRVETFRWGPRKIDVDLLLYDDIVHYDEYLEIPHPRFHERDFVLKPLVDLNPKIMHPVYKKSVKSIYAKLPKENLSIKGKGKPLK